MILLYWSVHRRLSLCQLQFVTYHKYWVNFCQHLRHLIIKNHWINQEIPYSRCCIGKSFSMNEFLLRFLCSFLPVERGLPDAALWAWNLLVDSMLFYSECTYSEVIRTLNILSRARKAGTPSKATARAQTRDTHCPLFLFITVTYDIHTG